MCYKQCHYCMEFRLRKEFPQRGHKCNECARRCARGRYKTSTTARAKTMLRSARARAKKKGLDFSLDDEWLIPKLVLAKCEVSGIPLSFSETTKAGPASPTIDRIDSSKGYVPGNCRLIASVFNNLFGSWGEERAIGFVIRYLAYARHRVKNLSAALEKLVVKGK